MNIIVYPGHPLRGEAQLPGDKSISHRAALFAAIADGESRIENFLTAGVTDVMLQALSALGISWQLDGTTLTVQGRGLRGLQPPTEPIYCGNSATTIRLLAGLLAAAGIPAVLDGSDGLRRRPMGRIIEPLQAMGVPISAREGQFAPLTLRARPATQPLLALEYSLPVASAQVKSCLLLAAMGTDDPVVLREPGPSRDHTERMLAGLGFTISADVPSHTVSLTGPRPRAIPPLRLTIPADISAGSFLVVASKITRGSLVTMRNIGVNQTRTGILDALEGMSAAVDLSDPRTAYGEPVADLTIAAGGLAPTRVSGDLVVRMIDEFPIFSVAAAYAQGATVVAEAEDLRHKESDRISGLCRQLRTLGVDAQEREDGFVICGSGQVPGGASVQALGDHRIAMSMIVAGLAAQAPVTVCGAEYYRESFPQFLDTLQALGAQLHIEAEAEPCLPATDSD